MRCNVPKFDYFEMPLKAFIKKFPDAIGMFPPDIDFNDSDYIVRFNDNVLEFGYAEDEWLLNQNKEEEKEHNE